VRADFLRQLGATLADDGIPLHFGDQAAEYAAALNTAVLMERSHEGRLSLRGDDRLAFVQRMSTNDVLKLSANQATPTIFTNPVGRVIDRVTLVNRAEDALLLAEPGRAAPLHAYLQRQIFFNDAVQIHDLAPETRQFVLLGPAADAVAAALGLPADAGEMRGAWVNIADTALYAVRVKPLSGAQWVLLVPTNYAEAVFDAVLRAGADDGLRPAGSLTYHLVRVRAGRPGVGRELSTDYIPLEIGLWDEVSFGKGCYTGQEIIARMESRHKLAKTIVQISLDAPVDTPVPLTLNGREVGTLTSCAAAPDAFVYGIGIVKLAAAVRGTVLEAGGVRATILQHAGAQPPELTQDDGS
jgi:aminomethyltransferase